mmetsp:Transcript_68693/g.128159  ORF Transcript_68693/g.128159 Transcript_68693/m.128159 type:complete len:209 (+) Transcript_68693:241-867(+)
MPLNVSLVTAGCSSSSGLIVAFFATTCPAWLCGTWYPQRGFRIRHINGSLAMCSSRSRSTALGPSSSPMPMRLPLCVTVLRREYSKISFMVQRPGRSTRTTSFAFPGIRATRFLPCPSLAFRRSASKRSQKDLPSNFFLKRSWISKAGKRTYGKRSQSCANPSNSKFFHLPPQKRSKAFLLFTGKYGTRSRTPGGTYEKYSTSSSLVT